jgi:hypothetical protein
MELEGRIWKDGKFWLVEIPILDAMTQGKSRKDALRMIEDAVTGLTGYSYNCLLRAVHDVFGHAAHNFQFGPRGEENAYHLHCQMFHPESIPALTSETRGQNCWVNFGPHLRNAKGEIPMKGEEGYIMPCDRPFAPQKAGLLPEDLITQVCV